jgi:ATP-dependent helicase/nuclease subunit B
MLLGPAGSGKTFRCLEEIRQRLRASPEGNLLLLLAPKQTTYQLERQLLTDPELPGYTRLQILSFERLAKLAFDWCGKAEPEMLDEEGRVMVLRGLIARNRGKLKLFRASARLSGFARQLSVALRELQRELLTPDALRAMAGGLNQTDSGLAFKLQDLATLLEDYSNWLQRHQLKDADSLLSVARDVLQEAHSSLAGSGAPASAGAAIEHLWVDGFAEFSKQELGFLASLLPLCEAGTITFCLDSAAADRGGWISSWAMARRAFEECSRRLGEVPGVELEREALPRDPRRTRFGPLLQELERRWSEPDATTANREPAGAPVESALRLALCANPEGEATLAAREILRHVRQGGRWREVAVLVRSLEICYQPLQRVFTRYEIPFFLDRRESVAHHPLTELTRSALRTVAFQWASEDWFAALKTGLAPAAEAEIDKLENEALARGWRGETWTNGLVVKGDAGLTTWLGELSSRLLPPFQNLARAMASCAHRPTGPQLTAALRELWRALKIEQRLDTWSAAPSDSARLPVPQSVHATVWEQMNVWLENVDLAFADEALPLREWLPILEAGLDNLSVGVIPPGLDQVLLGQVDRSRNPDVKLALVLGLNETVFPARPSAQVLLTEQDRLELAQRQMAVGATQRDHLARERYYAYLAFTRSRERLVLTSAQQDSRGSPLNPSPFFERVRRLFPAVGVERVDSAPDWRHSEHISELLPQLLRPKAATGTTSAALVLPAPLRQVPGVIRILEQFPDFRVPDSGESLNTALAARLYGPVLHSSVSRMEQFAACPFRFFVHSGLRAEERQKLEVDVREQGTFQHDVLAMFHQELQAEGKRWREVTSLEARERVGRLAAALVTSYRDGLLQASEQTRFLARTLTDSLQDFIETAVDWMREQYQFDPVAVELPFGEDGAPAWAIELEGRHQLQLHGRIDRVDLYRSRDNGEALCVVMDYKSSQKQLDPLLMVNGLQLQLLGYLNVLLRWPAPEGVLGVARLVPAGVFYVNLRGVYQTEANRGEALAEPGTARRLAYRHSGRFDKEVLRLLDARTDAREGDQFNYRLTNNGDVNRQCREPLAREQFLRLLEWVETNLRLMGNRIYAGDTRVDPFRKGSVTACAHCSYSAICRIDPWTHRFRVLQPVEQDVPEN